MPQKAAKSQDKPPEKAGVEKWTPFDHPHYVQFNAPVDAWGARLLNDSVKPHVDSFNLFTNEILGLMPDDISPAEMTWHDGTTVRCWLSDLALHQPIRGEDVLDPRLLPTHCRQAHITYSGELSGTVNVSLGTGEPPVQMARVPLGLVPIMVRSEACHLHGMPPSKMVQCGEDPDERGGYFIVNGNEKVVRLLIMPKSNFPVALYRPSFSNRGPLYSAYAVQMRSMRPDLTTQTVTMHYRKDGTCWVRFTYLKNEYLIPLMLLLKCLAPDELNSERSLFELLCDGLMADTFVAERVTCMLEQMRTHPELKHVHSREDALYYLGSKFEVVFREKRGAGVSLDGIALEVDDSAMSPVEKSVSVARRLLDSLMLVHCPKGAEGGKAKVDCLVLIFRKLMALVRGDIAPDNADAMDVQELLLPGQLFGALLKEVLQSSLC
ncbi:DNA-directed RNA polymerase I subunit RPA2 [Perkinsus olseni]|uniref:DNA-directed RNA polymerase n=1 Tax=Perkinsus olseni TaxID=32597 RepID=A0A7J6NPY9_PEROL|nr:DNA-directed RNA polymerase I subunit RPA2 [Perkinsus olseni]